MVNKPAIKEFIRNYNNTSELARHAGIHRSYIHMFLSDRREPGIKFIEGMMNAGMKAEDIFQDEVI